MTDDSGSLGPEQAELVDAYRRLIADVHELANVTQRLSDVEAKQIGATASQWHVLSVISDGARTVPAIAARLGRSRQAVQRTSDELVAAGYATTRRNPSKARSPLIEATESGMALQGTLYARSALPRFQMLQRADLGVHELAVAGRAVRRLLEALA